MTLPQECRLVGILSYHVRDLVLAGNESDPLHLSALETIGGLYDWGSWEAGRFEMCGCRVQQNVTEASRWVRLNMLLPVKPFPSQHTDDDINTRCSLDMNITRSLRNEVNSGAWHSKP